MTTRTLDLADFLHGRLPEGMPPELPIDTLAALLLYNLVTDSSDITIRIKGGDGVLAMEFEVGAANKGRVIGKNGHIIKAIRSLCRGIEKGRGRDVILDLVGWQED